VEEHELTRKLWKEYYQENAWPLEVFENPLEFLEQLERFSQRDEKMYFFFDQDFGNIRGVGVQLARAVRGLNRYQTVSLVTYHVPSSFVCELREGLLQYVFEKYPEHLFGVDFLDSRIKKQPKLCLQLSTSFDKQCALEKALGFDGWHLDFTLEEHFPARAPKPAPTPQLDSTPQTPKQVVIQSAKAPWWKRMFSLIGAEA
jgi:hypothetical protein